MFRLTSQFSVKRDGFLFIDAAPHFELRLRRRLGLRRGWTAPVLSWVFSYEAGEETYIKQEKSWPSWSFGLKVISKCAVESAPEPQPYIRLRLRPRACAESESLSESRSLCGSLLPMLVNYVQQQQHRIASTCLISLQRIESHKRLRYSYNNNSVRYSYSCSYSIG